MTIHYTGSLLAVPVRKPRAWVRSERKRVVYASALGRERK